MKNSMKLKLEKYIYEKTPSELIKTFKFVVNISIKDNYQKKKLGKMALVSLDNHFFRTYGARVRAWSLYDCTTALYDCK